MLENTINVTSDTLLHEAAVRVGVGQRCRFVTLTCLDLGGEHEILYHFDRDYRLTNLRLVLPKGQPLPSITSVCPAAVIVENELQDLFGITVAGLAIDYGGRLLLAENAPAAPLNKPRLADSGAKIDVVATSANASPTTNTEVTR